MSYWDILRAFFNCTGRRPINRSTPEEHSVLVACPCCGDHKVQIRPSAMCCEDTVIEMYCDCELADALEAVGVSEWTPGYSTCR